MINFNGTSNPVGSYKPEFMRKISGGWNTCISGQPRQTGADVLNNCVGWVQGRALQIYMDVADVSSPGKGNIFDAFNCDPNMFLTVAKNRGFEIVSSPMTGSIFVTDSHVGIVEWKDDNGWLISESGYGYQGAAVLFQYSIYKENGKWYSAFATDKLIRGFIRIPKVKDSLAWEKVWRLKDGGTLLKGWQKVKGKWYYMDNTGAMLTGWQKINNKWYYMDSSGAMLKGWQKLLWDGKTSWYYFDDSGAMKTGWLKLDNKWYYLKPDGAMVTGDYTIDGKVYHFNSSGVWIP